MYQYASILAAAWAGAPRGAERGRKPMPDPKWITRDYVKVDRVACPWLIKKFVDQDAEFVFVPPDKVMEAVRSGAHTRMPVYEGTLDNVVGIVNTKDLFYLFSLRGVVVLEDAMYPPLFLKPEENVATALRSNSSFTSQAVVASVSRRKLEPSSANRKSLTGLVHIAC